MSILATVTTIATEFDLRGGDDQVPIDVPVKKLSERVAATVTERTARDISSTTMLSK
jgi:hypothetical protein